MPDPAIEADGIGRVFGRGHETVTALRDVSFRVEPGEIVALLGSNGAGKTTLIKILSTLLLPSSGRATIMGNDLVRDVRQAREATSVIFGGDRGLYSRLSGRDNVRFFGMLAGVGRRELRQRVPTVLEQVNLVAAADRRVETYSKGMRQRLHIAIGLIARPMVLLLDEPTVGLDPIESDRLRHSISDLRDDGVAILLTSHYLLDVEKLASRALLLNNGVITQDLTLAEFVQKAGHAATVTICGRGVLPQLADSVANGVVVGEMRGDEASWEVDIRLREWKASVFSQFADIFATVEVDDVHVRETRLEEAFAKLWAGAAL